MKSIKVVFPSTPPMTFNDKVEVLPKVGDQYITDWETVFSDSHDFSRALQILEEDSLEVEKVEGGTIFLKESNS